MKCSGCGWDFNYGTVCPVCGFDHAPNANNGKTNTPAPNQNQNPAPNYNPNQNYTSFPGYNPNQNYNPTPNYDPNPNYAPNTYAPNPNFTVNQAPANNNQENPPMKWYKFIKVILIISMSLNLFSGMMSVVSVFLFNSALSAYNLFSAVVSIGMGIMALFAWLGLRNYRSYGPKLLVTLYSVNLGISAFSVFSAITNSLVFGS